MENINDSKQENEEFFNLLVGKKCWSVIAGPGTGSMVSLAFGEKIQRGRPLKNPALSHDQREFDGEFVVFIKDAVWEVRNNDAIVCTKENSNEVGGLMLSGLNLLIGKSVSSVIFSAEHNTFQLIFNGTSMVQMTCSDNSNDADGYSLHHSINPYAQSANLGKH